MDDRSAPTPGPRPVHQGANEEPFGWWGPVWTSPAPHSILDLLRDGVLSSAAAALLWALLQRRASLVVVAGPSGAGKTTLLTALLDFLPVGQRRVYLRGCYESFRFLAEADPRTTTLLVNEISGHLPIYLWGAGVRRALAAARAGYALAATAHAASVPELVRLLAGYPLRVPPAEIAALRVVVVLEAWRDGETICREVREVAALSATPTALRMDRLAWRATRGGALTLDLAAVPTDVLRPGEPRTAFIQEVTERSVSLRGLIEAGALHPPDVAGALRRQDERWVAGGGFG